MKGLEFLNDRYAQFNLAWDLEGKIFNRLPLIKKLKWREYIAFKGMWGHLTVRTTLIYHRMLTIKTYTSSLLKHVL